MNIKFKKLSLSISKFINNADKFLALTFIFLGIIASVFLIKFNKNLLPAPIAITIFSALYLLNIKYDVKNSYYAHFSEKNTTILFITILILVNISLISFIFRPDLYSRPSIYFILISIVSGLLAFVIMYLPQNKYYEYLALFSIIIIGLSLRLLPQLLFPTLLGIDPWTHMNFTNQIIDLGHLMEGFGYSRLPSMHILIASASILTGLNYKWSSVISVTIPQLVSFIIIYLIGKSIFNSKVGLLGALLLCISANYICIGFWIFPTTFALIASTFLLYYLIKEEKHDSATDATIKILFAILIVSTHMQVALAILIFLISFWVGKKAYIMVQSNEFNFIYSNKVKYVFIVLFAVLMFGWWIYVSQQVVLPFTFISRALQHDPSQIKDVTATVYKIPYYQYVTNILPYLFFYGFSVVGFLYSISKKSNNLYTALTLGGIALLATPFLLMESNMSGYLAERWIYAAQLFMSIPVAVGVLKIFQVTKKKTVLKSIVIISLISIFAFINLINPSANIDNTQVSTDSIVRYALTGSELQSINTLQNYYTGSISTDFINSFPINGEKSNLFDKKLENKNFTKVKGMVLLRSILANSTVHGMKLDYDPIKVFSLNSTFDRIYDSGHEVAFYKFV